MLFKSKSIGIISGPLEAYCLVCISYLKSESELIAHIEKPTHKKNLESTPYHDQYKDQSIRKVMAGYYCEFCNILLSTSALVGIHIIKTEHVYNRNIETLRRVKNGVVAFKNVFISENAWNGIKDKSCSTCNVELRDLYFDVHNHKIEHIHAVNLIKSKIEFYGESLYRKCSDAFHCLTCNTIFSLEEGMNHFETSDHKTKYDECCKKGTDILNEGKQASVNKTENHNKNADDDTNKAGPSNSVKKGQNKSNTLSDNIKCVNDNYIELEKEMCDKLGAKNYIIDDVDPKCARCILCDYTMLKEFVPMHLNHRHHHELLKIHKARLIRMSMDNSNLVNDHKDATNTEDGDNRAKILNSTVEFQKNKINIDFVSCTAVCKKCSSSLKFEFNSIVSHIEEHKTKQNTEAKQEQSDGNQSKVLSEETKEADGGSKPQSSKASTNSPAAFKEKSSYTEEMQTYMKDNNLQQRNDRVYCTVCNVQLPVTLKNWKEHVNGLQHRLRTKQSQQSANANRNTLRRVCVRNFIESIMFVGNHSGDYVLFNDAYCLTHSSFLMFATENDPINYCYVCMENFNAADLRRHLYSHKHMSKFESVNVITSLDNEFVRELQHDVYHCGYCNTTQSDWNAMENHLKGALHKENKSNGLHRVQNFRQRVQAFEEVRINHALARIFRNIFH